MPALLKIIVIILSELNISDYEAFFFSNSSILAAHKVVFNNKSRQQKSKMFLMKTRGSEITLTFF